ncbi:MAG: sigma-70 family RNA polymerase sigma factor [Endomicrobiia bacterium]
MINNISDNIKILNTVETINEKQFRMLLRKYRATKNPKIKEQIVNGYLNLVISVAKSYYNKYNNPNIELSDLIEEGIFGLLKALNRYKFSKNVSFRIYATYWIKNSIQHYVKEKSGLIVQIPTPTLILLKKWVREWQKIYKKLGQTPTLKNMMDRLKISFRKAKKIVQVLNAYTKISSLDTPLEDEETTLGEMVIDKDLTPEEILSKVSTYETLNDVFKKVLSEREAAVIKHRYHQSYKNGQFEKRLSYRKIANMFNLSAEYIRRIEKSALAKLRNYLSSKI